MLDIDVVFMYVEKLHVHFYIDQTISQYIYTYVHGYRQISSLLSILGMKFLVDNWPL